MCPISKDYNTPNSNIFMSLNRLEKEYEKGRIQIVCKKPKFFLFNGKRFA